MNYMRYFYIFLILVLDVKGIYSEYKLEPWEEEIKYSVNFLEKLVCERGIQIGDIVHVDLTTFSIPPTSKSRINSSFKVGDFGVSYVNQAILDMCIGEIKRIGIPIGNGKIFYQFKVLTVNSEL